MALPQAVQRQVEAAEALLTGGTQPADQPQAETQAQPEPQQEPTAAESVSTPQPSPAPQQPQNEWEQRYKVLQGKFNNEVPSLHHQVKDLTRKLQDQSERMEQLSRSQETKQAEQKQAADPKDVDAFGADLVEMVQRVTQQTLGGITAKMDGLLSGFQQRLAYVEQQLQGTSQTVAYTAEQTFFAQLSKAVPDWEKINADQRFLTWLGEVDPVLGSNRQAALDTAQKNMDANRVAAIFRAFESALPKTPVKPGNNLSKQISPSSVASAAPTPTDKPILTQAQVQAYYKDVATGKYRGREAEAAKLESIINQALAENRIQ